MSAPDPNKPRQRSPSASPNLNGHKNVSEVTQAPSPSLATEPLGPAHPSLTPEPQSTLTESSTRNVDQRDSQPSAAGHPAPTSRPAPVPHPRPVQTRHYPSEASLSPSTSNSSVPKSAGLSSGASSFNHPSPSPTANGEKSESVPHQRSQSSVPFGGCLELKTTADATPDYPRKKQKPSPSSSSGSEGNSPSSNSGSEGDAHTQVPVSVSQEPISFNLSGQPLLRVPEEYEPRQLVKFEPADNEPYHASIVYDEEGDEAQRGFVRVQDGRLHVVVSFALDREKVEAFRLIIPQKNGVSLEREPIGGQPERPVDMVSGDEHYRAYLKFKVEAKELEVVETEIGGVVLHRVYFGYHDLKEHLDFAIPFRVLCQPETDPYQQRNR